MMRRDQLTDVARRQREEVLNRAKTAARPSIDEEDESDTISPTDTPEGKTEGGRRRRGRRQGGGGGGRRFNRVGKRMAARSEQMHIQISDAQKKEPLSFIEKVL